MASLERRLIIRVAKENDVVGFISHRISGRYINYDISFFDKLTNWSITKEGYDFWFNCQMQLCFLLIYFKRDSKNLFHKYNSYSNRYESCELVKLKEKYSNLYKKYIDCM